MNTQKHIRTLQQIPADRTLVEALYAHGKINQQARIYALNFLCPQGQWGFWVAQLLMATGVLLLAAGVVYFFAFNWAQIPPLGKLFSIQLGIAGAVTGVCFYSLRRRAGQVLLLFASLLVGIFIAVFGQIYQMGADSYQLFMVWALSILGWTLLSNFAVQWFFWLIIANIFLVAYWQQAIRPEVEMKFMLFTYLAILNGGILVLREYLFIKKEYKWLGAKWVRAILCTGVLFIMLIPVIAWVHAPNAATFSIIISGIVGLLGHGVAFYFYRFRQPDMWPLVAVVFSGCIICEWFIFKAVLGASFWKVNAELYFFMGVVTLGVFAIAAFYLRHLAKRLAKELGGACA